MNLDAIEARAEAATPGPWLQRRMDPGQIGRFDGGCWFTLVRVVTWEGPDPDAAFIAHARTDVPALIARVRELEAELAERERAS